MVEDETDPFGYPLLGNFMNIGGGIGILSSGFIEANIGSTV